MTSDYITYSESIQNVDAANVLEKDDLGVESYTLNNDPEDKIERLCREIEILKKTNCTLKSTLFSLISSYPKAFEPNQAKKPIVKNTLVIDCHWTYVKKIDQTGIKMSRSRDQQNFKVRWL
ncbi:33785_t:CDS:2, partial [Gigaspora margarita]